MKEGKDKRRGEGKEEEEKGGEGRKEGKLEFRLQCSIKTFTEKVKIPE